MQVEVDAANWIAIDRETTRLNPLQHELRLLQLAMHDKVDAASKIFVIDVPSVPFQMLRPLVCQLFGADGPRLAFHNASFDVLWLQVALDIPEMPPAARLFDTLIASRILDARGKSAREEEGNAPPPVRNGLRHVVQRHLGYELSKGEQKSGWDKADLPDAKWDYASKDAAATLELARVLDHERADQRLGAVMDFEMKALEAIIWMTNVGAPVDVERWMSTIPPTDVLLTELNGEAGLPADETRLWNTAPRVRDLFAERGLDLPDTRVATLQALTDQDPLVPLLLQYRGAAKASGTYGHKMLDGMGGLLQNTGYMPAGKAWERTQAG